MTRPSVKHDGFLIPNASEVTNPRMAEPDAIDFNTLAHPLWGVIEGCSVSVSGTTATTNGGLCLVNGKLVKLIPGSIGLGTSGTQDRYVLLVSDAAGNLTLAEGGPAVDPVFPDPSPDQTVLAAVFCPSGSGNLSDNLVDKRKFISKSLLTKIGVNDPLIQNVNGTGDYFRVNGGGRIMWGNGDAFIEYVGEGKLHLHNRLDVDWDFNCGGFVIGEWGVVSHGIVVGTNLRMVTVDPLTYPLPGGNSMQPGSLWQNSVDGRLYKLNTHNQWDEIATLASSSPPGTIIQSVELPTVMTPLGWLQLKGDTVDEANYPNLFKVQGLSHLFTGTAPTRQMVLPNAQDLMLVTDWNAKAGTKVSTNVNNLVTLTTNNMPKHKHGVDVLSGGGNLPTVTIGRDGAHSHSTLPGGGAHGHDVTDDGHRHHGMEGVSGQASAVIGLFWGGNNKIDALFNDRNHTYSVEPLQWSMSAVSNITVGTGGSTHVHQLSQEPDHTHTATVTGNTTHDHSVTENFVGLGQAFDITPEYLTVYSYIRS